MWLGLNHSISIKKKLFQPGSLSTTGWATHIHSHGMLKHKFSFNNIRVCVCVCVCVCGGGYMNDVMAVVANVAAELGRASLTELFKIKLE